MNGGGLRRADLNLSKRVLNDGHACGLRFGALEKATISSVSLVLTVACEAAKLLVYEYHTIARRQHIGHDERDRERVGE